MTSGKLAEISLAKAYSLDLDFCDLTEILQKLCHCASRYKQNSFGDRYYRKNYEIKNNSSSGQFYSRWLRECVMGFGAFHLEFYHIIQPQLRMR